MWFHGVNMWSAFMGVCLQEVYLVLIFLCCQFGASAQCNARNVNEGLSAYQVWDNHFIGPGVYWNILLHKKTGKFVTLDCLLLCALPYLIPFIFLSFIDWPILPQINNIAESKPSIIGKNLLVAEYSRVLFQSYALGCMTLDPARKHNFGKCFICGTVSETAMNHSEM